MKTEIKGLSPSSLDLWEQCPRRFREEKLMDRQGGSSYDSLRGTFIHLILEHLMAYKPSERTFDSARKAAVAAWREFSATDEWLEWVEETKFTESRELRQSAWASVCGYFEAENPQVVDVVARERWIDAKLDGVPVRGIIDRLDRDVFEDLFITDYKGGKVTPPPFRQPKIRQLNIYGAMVEAETGERPTGGQLIFTTYAEIVATNFTDESIGQAVQDLRKAWDGIYSAIETLEFPPNPGPLCGWCPFALECPEGAEMVMKRHAMGKRDGPSYHALVERDAETL